MSQKISIIDLREQLAEAKRAETIAQTREQMLTEEKQKLLIEIQAVLVEIEKIGLFSREELTPVNLPNIILKLYSHIETEIEQSKIPRELL